jgi:hypothetical protein
MPRPAVGAVAVALNTTMVILLSRYSNLHVPSVGTIFTLDVEAYGGNTTLRD